MGTRLKKRWTWFRRPAPPCLTGDRSCELAVEYETVYHSPDGQAFQVRRLLCADCGRREMNAARHDSVAEPVSAWFDGDDVQANIWSRP